MSLATNIVRIGSRYYYRKRIPADLRHIFPSPIYKVSLKTSCPIAAKQQAAKVAYEFVNFFQGLRMSQNDNPNDLDSDKIEKSLMKIYMDLSPVVFESDQRKLQENEEDLRSMERRLHKKSLIDHNPKLADGANGIENRFRQFMESRKGRINPGYLDLHPVICGYFTSICGVKNVNEYDVDDATKYKNIALSIPQYPANWQEYFGTKDLLKVLELNKKKKKPTISMTTYHGKHVAILSKFFSWCKTHDFITTNHFTEMKFELTPQEETAMILEKRQPFNIKELQTIFSSPDFVNQKKDYMYFAPLVLLFSGMRFGELSQLKIKDIIDRNGYKHFNLRTTDKVLKTKASYRFIPLHDELVKVGFLNFVDEQLKRKKDPEDRIFDINYNEARKSYDSRRLTRFLDKFKKQGLLRDTVVVHSFRHSYRNGLVSSGVDSESIAMAMGHSFRDAESGQDYNDGEIKKIQSEKVLSLKYEGLDISHLYI